MPIYEIQGKDGRVYEIEGPAGLSRDQVIAAVLAQAPEAGEPRPSKSPIEEIPVVGGALSAVADVPLSITSGLAGTAKSITDVFGPDNAASGFLGDVAEGSQGLLSREAKEDFARDAREIAKAEGFWESAAAAGKAFMRHPLDVGGQLLGSAAPFAAAALTGGGVPAAIALGAVSGAGMIKGDIYEAVYARAKEAGVPDEQAKEIADKAQAYGGENLDMVALGAAIGAVANSTGISRQLASLIGGNAAKDVLKRTATREAEKGILRRGVSGFTEEALPEGVQGAQQKYAQNLAQQRAGFPTDVTEGVLEQGVYEGTLGGILGGTMGLVQPSDTGGAPPAPSSREAEEQTVMEEVSRIFAEDPELTDTQKSAAAQRAARLIVASNIRPEDALAIARDEQVKVAARQAQTAEQLTDEELDLGGGERGVPSVGRGLGDELAPELGGTGAAGLGDVSGAVSEPDDGEVGGEPALAPILDPKLKMADRVRLASEMVSETVMNSPDIQGLQDKVYGQAARQVAQAAAKGALLDVDTTIRKIAKIEIPAAPTLSEPTPEEAAVAPVQEALKGVAKGAPADAVPTVAQTAARKTGIAPTPIDEEIAARDEDVSGDLIAAPEAEPAKTVDEALTAEALATPEVAPVEVDQTLPEDVRVLQEAVNEFNPGFEVRYDPKAAKPYQYGVAGQKTLGRFTTLQGVERAIRKQPMLKPKKVVEGVEVKQMPAAKAKGLAARQNEDYQMSRDAVDPMDKAGKPNAAQEAQIRLLEKEIDKSRANREINDRERTQLVDMLRTPPEITEALELIRKGGDTVRAMALLENADPAWRASAELQAEIDQLTREGRQIREQELALEREQLELKKANKKPTPQQMQSFEDRKTALTERAEAVAERTRERGDKLLPYKQKIYQRVKIALADMRLKRATAMAKLNEDFRAGKLSPVQYRSAMSELRPESMRFRKGAVTPDGISLEAMNRIVKDVMGRVKLRLTPRMVQSVEDLPNAIRTEMEAADRLDAFGFLKDGVVYLIADNMHAESDVIPTLFHEALGHLGLRRLFREKLDDVLVDLYRSNKRLARAVDAWLEENPDQYAAEERLPRAVEEVFAEASEDGPLRPGAFDKLVKLIRDFIRQTFGINLKVTDGEINTILAMAHEQALEGIDAAAVGSSSVVYSKKASKEQVEGKEEVAKTTKGITSAMERIQTSAERINEEEFFGNLGSAVKLRTAQRFLKGLSPKRIANRFVPGGGLDALPTDGMLDYADTLLGKENTVGLRDATDAMETMNAYRAGIRRAQAKVTDAIKDFINKHGSNSLGDALFFADDYNMDLKRFKDGMTLDEAYATDSLWNWYSRKLADPNLDPDKKKGYQKALQKREGQIKEGVDAWVALGKFDGGREIFTDLSDTFKDMYETRFYLMRKYLEAQKAAGMSEEAVSKLMQSYSEQFERLYDKVNSPASEDAHADHPDVPLGIFYRQYMPKRRYGQYWLRIKKTKFGEPILYFFENKADRDEAWEQAAQRMGVNPENDAFFDKGNNVAMDLNDLGGVNTNTAFNKALNVIAGIDPENVTEATKQQLANDVYQLFLMAAPEGSVRKQFIKSKKRLGWSADILRTFNNVSEEYASDISRLTYAPEIDANLKDFAGRFGIEQASPAAAEEGEEPDVTSAMSTSKKELARDFLNNVRRRIESTMQPQADGFVNRIVPFINQLAFVSFLTAPATAVVQVTALPIRVAPHLYSKYGMAATSRAMGRYLNVFGNRAKFMEKGAEKRKSLRIATLREAPGVKNVKHRAEALKWATERGLTMPVSEFLLGEERSPTSAAQSKTKQATQVAYDAMTYLFDTTEQFTREVTFMAAYDLEYEKLKDAGLDESAREEKARQAAREVVNYTLGDFNNLNRPLLFKSSELAKALFLFKMYSAITTRFFVTNARTIFRGVFGKGEKGELAAATKELFGVLSMAFMFGGVTGLPLYTFGMLLLQALQDATDDDEDRRQRMIEDPYTADSVEMQFRYNWMPDHFGTPLVQGEDGNNYSLSDIILNGPLSEMSGWNFGSRVSLDLAGLWFRSPKDADNWKTTINNALVENIPGASASLNMVDMGEQFAKGDINKGLQLGMPAMFKAWAKTMDIAEEGVRTQTGKVKLANDALGNGDYLGLLLGFNPTEISKMQRFNRDVTNRGKELQSEKTKLVSAYTQAVRRINTNDPNGWDLLNEAATDILEYNSKIGNADFAISDLDLIASLRGAAGEEKYDIDGMGLTKTQAPYVQRLKERQ